MGHGVSRQHQVGKLDNLVWKVIPEKEKRLLILLERRKLHGSYKELLLA